MPNRYFLLVFLLCLPFGLFHLLTFSQYGMHWDEAAQHHLGQATVNFLQGKTEKIELQRPDLIYYGSLLEIINSFLGRFLLANFGLAYVDAFHILPFLIALLGLIFVFVLARELFDLDVAFYALLFLLFSPRFMAHAHYNLKDIPIAVFSTAAFYFLYQTITGKKIINALLAGLLVGLTVAVQVTSLMILPIFFIPYFLSLIFAAKGKRFWQSLKKLSPHWLIFSVSFLGTVFLAWPALWKDPWLFLKSIAYFLNHSWQGSVLYLGTIYKGSELPWHYTPVYLLLTIPLTMLAFAFVGIGESWQKILRKKAILKFGFLLSWIFLPIIISFKPGMVKYDGIRHYFLLFPALAIMAGVGLRKFFQYLFRVKAQYQQSLPNIFLFLIFLGLAYETLRISPYGGSYFNQILRLFIPSRIENVFEIEYWGTSYREGVVWLNENASRNAIFCVPFAEHLLQFYPLRKDLGFGCNQNTNYLMLITRKTYYPTGLETLLSKSQLIYAISRYHSHLLEIYRLH